MPVFQEIPRERETAKVVPWARLAYCAQNKVSPSSAILRALTCLCANHWIHREHIYRCHQSPTFRCMRCQISFENEETLAEHHQTKTPCETKTPSSDEEIIYISSSQERKLRKKKRYIEEEKRWFDCFRIIFPDVPGNQLPTPCKPKTPRRAAMGMSADDRHGKIMIPIRIHCPIRRYSASFVHSWSNIFHPVFTPA